MGAYFSCSGYKSSWRLDGKVAVITGCDTGIGKAVLKEFYTKGATIYMACINIENAKKTASELEKEFQRLENLGKLFVVYLDLANFDSVRICAKRILNVEEKIDLLVNNAGMILVNPEEITRNGFEVHFATNYLGHFLLTLLLLPAIIRVGKARIINVASLEHRGKSLNFDDLNWTTRKYDPYEAYAESKLAVILFTKELTRRLKGAGYDDITTYSICPGLVATNIIKNIVYRVAPCLYWCYLLLRPILLKTPEQGAETIIYCALDEKCAKESGEYYSNCEVQEPEKNTVDPKLWKKLWEKSYNLVKLDLNYNPFLDKK